MYLRAPNKMKILVLQLVSFHCSEGQIWRDNRWMMTVGGDRTSAATAQSAACSISGTQTAARSPGIDRHSVRVDVRATVGNAAAGDGVWLGDGLLAAIAGVAARRGMGAVAPDTARQSTPTASISRARWPTARLSARWPGGGTEPN